ncbi:unnamed protein product [Symbiodinium sp. KB8]|nr:unnamed protein product [Symbiodinium sp. KB8]
MKRPAAAASRKHVRKGTLKKPAAAPVAYDVQIAARGERLDRGEVPQDQGAEFLCPVVMSQLYHVSLIWATLAKYHGKFDRVYRRRDDAKLMGLTDRTKAFVREYCSKHPSARIQQLLQEIQRRKLQKHPPAEKLVQQRGNLGRGSRTGLSLGKMTEWNSADYDHFFETAPRFADNRASPHFEKLCLVLGEAGPELFLAVAVPALVGHSPLFGRT